MELFWTVFLAVVLALIVYRVFLANRYKQQLNENYSQPNSTFIIEKVSNMSDKEKIDILLALFAVRCSEISCVYWYIRRKQKEVKDGYWIELFLENCLNSLIPESTERYGSIEENEKIRNGNKEKAKLLSESRFPYCYNEGIKNKNALRMAVFNYNGAYRLDRIRAIRNYGLLQDKLSTLIKQYEMFESISLETFIYEEFYHTPQAIRAEKIDQEIKLIWSEITLHLKSLLILMQIKKDNSFDIEKLLNDIYALETLEFNLPLFLSESNATKAEGSSFSRPEHEKLVRSVCENHPIRNI